MLSFRIAWYVTWVFLALGVVVLSVYIFVLLQAANNLESMMTFMFPLLILSTLIIIPVFIFMIYRVFNAIFSVYFLIEKDCTEKQAFETSLSLMKGNWGQVFGMVLATSIVLSFIPSTILNFGMNTINYEIFKSISVLYSNIFLTPFIVSFIYFLMLYIKKKKQIN
jgi:hypothetical protein